MSWNCGRCSLTSTAACRRSSTAASRMSCSSGRCSLSLTAACQVMGVIDLLWNSRIPEEDGMYYINPRFTHLLSSEATEELLHRSYGTSSCIKRIVIAFNMHRWPVSCQTTWDRCAASCKPSSSLGRRQRCSMSTTTFSATRTKCSMISSTDRVRTWRTVILVQVRALYLKKSRVQLLNNQSSIWGPAFWVQKLKY